MADCLANLLNLSNQTTEMFETMNAEDACRFTFFLFLKKNKRIFFLIRSIY